MHELIGDQDIMMRLSISNDAGDRVLLVRLIVRRAIRVWIF